MLPAEFVERLSALVPPPRLAGVLASFAEPKSTTFRLNTLHPDWQAGREALAAAGLLSQPVCLTMAGGAAAALPVFRVALHQREALTHHASAAQGQIYIQSVSSMLAALWLDPQPGDWVLDLAAAPGGKTSLLAQLMANQGRISAVEPVKDRFFRLQANLQRLQVQNTRCYLKDGRAIGALKPASFDRVLLDAPCSSESRFRSDQPDSMAHWSLRKVAEAAHKQKRLILSAWSALKPGGTLLYCTCSFAPEENEAVVAHLLRRHPEASLQPVQPPAGLASQPGLTDWQGKAYPEALQHSVRILPDADVDGFYLARICKTG